MGWRSMHCAWGCKEIDQDYLYVIQHLQGGFLTRLQEQCNSYSVKSFYIFQPSLSLLSSLYMMVSCRNIDNIMKIYTLHYRPVLSNKVSTNETKQIQFITHDMCTNYICTMEFTFIRNTPPLSRKLCIKSLKQSFSFAWMIFLNKCTPYNFIIHWDTLFKNYVKSFNGIFSNTITIVYSMTILRFHILFLQI